MAVNLASKYSTKVDEAFTLGSITGPATNQDYEFTGVQTVHVLSIGTAVMNDYNRIAATNRYGEPAELQDTKQDLTMTKDRSFAFTIDKGNYTDQQMTKNAGAALRRQIDLVVTPEIDKYRLDKIVAGAGASATAVVTKTTAYEKFLDGQEALTEKLAPVGGRVCYASAAYYKLIKQDEAFIKNADLAQQMLLNGQVGMIDGVPVILTPSAWLPTNTAFVITNSIACVAPIKLADYKIHEDPPGINGWLVEGRVYYDAFVLNNKANAIYVHKTA